MLEVSGQSKFVEEIISITLFSNIRPTKPVHTAYDQWFQPVFTVLIEIRQILSYQDPTPFVLYIGQRRKVKEGKQMLYG